ncbi:hypothetical protein TNCV_2685301 [Trichonephila clavipes]|nr:hypothetical protein TNCV_2685301 [Trichonephila clavipes]
MKKFAVNHNAVDKGLRQKWIVITSSYPRIFNLERKKGNYDQREIISDDSNKADSEDVLLPDEVDVFVENEDDEGINDTTEV